MTTPVTASAIAAALGASLEGTDREVVAVAPLSDARRDALTFAVDATKSAQQVRAALDDGAVVIVAAGDGVPEAGSGAVITVVNPRGAFAIAVQSFFVPAVLPGVAATAVVHPSALIDPTAHIGEFSVVGAGVVVGPHAEVRNHVVLGDRVRLGAHAVIKSHAVIGEEGFGVDKDADGNNVRLPHVGSVIIGDHVEVGNFTTVCSGTLAPTRIGDFTKIDDHVHVAHNCHIGSNVIITACAEISGSVTVGDRAWFGPNSSVIQGVTIGEDALVGIGAVVTKSVPANEVQFGSPARRVRDNIARPTPA